MSIRSELPVWSVSIASRWNEESGIQFVGRGAVSNSLTRALQYAMEEVRNSPTWTYHVEYTLIVRDLRNGYETGVELTTTDQLQPIK